MGRDKHIAIVGAGLVGSLAAIYFVQHGYKVSVYDRRPDLRQDGSEAGRSINLALSNRGWKPLKELGLEEEVKKMVIPMKGRMMHNEQGELTFQPYGKEGQHINSISRDGLNRLLMNTAEKAGVQFFFNRRCTYVNYKTSTITFDVSGHTDSLKTDIIIGADGAYSAVRNAIQRTDKFNYSQYFIDYGYKELSIPPSHSGEHKLEKNALHIWPRGQFMLIALPNIDGSFTVTLFLPYEGAPSFESLSNEQDVKEFFEKTFSDALELMPSLTDHWTNNPTSSLVTIQCYPWVKKNILLIGDASHAVVPFYGQGMNSGFEDCRVLNELIVKHDHKWRNIFEEFQQFRKPDADAISELALQNFVEMRDHVADDMFLLRKHIEAMLHEQFPDKWIPQYSMVTFHDEMRYSEAREIGKRQKEIMDEVMAIPDIKESWRELNLEDVAGRLDLRREM
jgi:kynurenine 3-monooxygenase